MVNTSDVSQEDTTSASGRYSLLGLKSETPTRAKRWAVENTAHRPLGSGKPESVGKKATNAACCGQT